MITSRFGLSLTAVLALFAVNTTATAQQYPSKSITVITPFPPGSGPDAVLRLVGERLSRALGQQVIVENRPGGNGVIALQAAKKANPDGYTFVQVDNMHLAAQPYLYKKLPYDIVKDFEPVAALFRNYFFITVAKTSKWNTVSDLVSAAKAQPAMVTYGSWFTGSPGHLGGVLLENATGVRMSHVPYKETSQLYTSVGNEEVSWAFGSAGSAGAMYRAGKIKYLAIAAPKRIPGYEQVPTIAEAGGPANFELSAWVSLLAPRGTPQPVIDRVNQEVREVLSSADMKERLVASFAYEPFLLKPAEMIELINKESVRFGEIIKRSKITLD